MPAISSIAPRMKSSSMSVEMGVSVADSTSTTAEMGRTDESASLVFSLSWSLS